jgi:putative hydrolase of the HAD superfamily
MKQIKNIIFDFGGVLLDLDRQASLDAFVNLGLEDVEKYLNIYGSDQGIFCRLETGEISPAQFRDGIREMAGRQISDKEIDDAWLKFILDVPASKLDLLLRLRNRYRLFLLSNTNAIHIDYIIPDAFEKNGHAFSEYFEKVYYSYQLHLRKPDKAIFEYVLQDAGIRPEETLLVDDGEANIRAAAALGFNTFPVSAGEDLSRLLLL